MSKVSPQTGIREALAAFQQAAGTSGDNASDMRDMITAAAHWFDGAGFDVRDRFEAAMEVFEEEAL